MGYLEDNKLPAPTNVRINGKPEAENLATKSTGVVTISMDYTAALVRYNRARARVVLSADNFVTTRTVYTQWIRRGEAIEDFGDNGPMQVTVAGLRQNTRWRYRIWTEGRDPRVTVLSGSDGNVSSNFNSGDFWTNRKPNLPNLVLPLENAFFDTTDNVTFDWQFSDPDPGSPQGGYQLQWRESATTLTQAGPWTTIPGGAETLRVVPGSLFKGNRNYDWQIRVRDAEGLWSDWSFMRSFYMGGLNSPPTLLAPINDEAVNIEEQNEFRWRFRDPDPGDVQVKADLRYRVVGTFDWFLITGDTTTPGADALLYIPANTFQSGFHYEWQVRTYDAGSGGATPSDWSGSQTFYSIRTPGSAVDDSPIITDAIIKGALGCGTHRAFIYEQGGLIPRGEITPLSRVMWSRKRDDIANAIIDTNGFGLDCGQLLGEVRSWRHELVIFRDGPDGLERVFEGPITRITYEVDRVEIEAKDCMAYVYRRIMRQGYNDSYREVNGVRVGNGQQTVVDRATKIITNALAPSDPNLIPYLTPIRTSGDAKQSRIVPDYSKTAWEEVDDLAANAGLDYVTVGRRIMLWDTHIPIGKLPEMRDDDFSNPPVVTEYGMNLANYFAVTDNNGTWGAAIPIGTTDPQKGGNAFDYYGPIEQLASAYGESEADSTAPATPAALEKKREALRAQAQRNIANRWPTPLVVRVPDNSSLNPDVNVGINQLVPGVWIPLRAIKTVRQVSQWQKLDSLTVEETGGVERVKVVMSPAPNGGNDDPDADGGGEEV